MADDPAAADEDIIDGEISAPTDGQSEAQTSEADVESVAGKPSRLDGLRPRFSRPPSWSTLSPVRQALVVGLAFAVALVGLCGWLGYRAYQTRQAAEWHGLLVQVGRQGALNLTTIDYAHADDDVKRILDSATGQFYDEFSTRSAPFIDLVKKAQSKTVGTVTEAGVESMSANEGQVLVAVSVTTTNKGASDERPRYWRMRLTVDKNGDGAKVSKVDFVP